MLPALKALISKYLPQTAAFGGYGEWDLLIEVVLWIQCMMTL
jgi:hypothetical protein